MLKPVLAYSHFPSTHTPSPFDSSAQHARRFSDFMSRASQIVTHFPPHSPEKRSPSRYATDCDSTGSFFTHWMSCGFRGRDTSMNSKPLFDPPTKHTFPATSMPVQLAVDG